MTPNTMSRRRKVTLVGIPAVFDILATALCNMGFLYIPASVWQLLRGAMMVFAAIFAVVFLGRKLHGFHFAGLGFCVCGIMLVGAASIWGDEAEAQRLATTKTGPSMPTEPESLVILGMTLSLAGQVVQAAQV